MGPPHRPIPYARLRVEAAEDDEHIRKIFPTFFTEAGARRVIQVMLVQRDGEEEGDSMWIRERVNQSVPARHLSHKIPALTAEEAANGERNDRILNERQNITAKISAKAQAFRRKDTVTDPSALPLTPPPAGFSKMSAADSHTAVTPFTLSPTFTPKKRGRKKSTGEPSSSGTPTDLAEREATRRRESEEESGEGVSTPREVASSKLKTKSKKQEDVKEKKLQLPLRGAVFGVYGSSNPAEDDSEISMRQIILGLNDTVQNKKGNKDKGKKEVNAIVALQSQNIREGNAKFTHLITAQNTNKYVSHKLMYLLRYVA
ncbi:hypothetical protein EON65_08105 [archaeon]|nr:MAG: hypothetical protein EON65_08105 [archaeon]